MPMHRNPSESVPEKNKDFLTGRKIIIYGAGGYGRAALMYFGARNVACFVDNYKSTEELYLGKPVIRFEELLKIHENYDIVLAIRPTVTQAIIEELHRYNIRFVDYFEYYTEQEFASNPQVKKLKDIHKGQRCFIIGNGPSLKAEDLEKIHQNGDISIGMNRIYEIFQETAWRPDYYMAIDRYIIRKFRDQLMHAKVKKYFMISNEINSIFHDSFCRDQLIELNISCPHTACWSDEVDKILPVSGTSVYAAAQLAVYMGINEIILLGVDNTFNVNKMHFYTGNHVDPEIEHSSINRGIISADEFMYYHSTSLLLLLSECQKRGVLVKNASRGGHIEGYEHIDFDGLF